jgi:hypothetical protein
MTLSDADRAFLDRRRKLLTLWPWTGAGMIAGILGFATWLWMAVPLMINPWATIAAIESGRLEETTLTVMAVMLPILMLACLGVMVVLIGLLFAVFANERRLISLVEKQDSRHR